MVSAAILCLVVCVCEVINKADMLQKCAYIMSQSRLLFVKSKRTRTSNLKQEVCLLGKYEAFKMETLAHLLHLQAFKYKDNILQSETE